MTYDQAVRVFTEGSDRHMDLVDALTTLMDSPAATVGDFALGLRYPGFIAEQCAFRLHKMTGQPFPTPIGRLIENICNHLGLPYDAARDAAAAPTSDREFHASIAGLGFKRAGETDLHNLTLQIGGLLVFTLVAATAMFYPFLPGRFDPLATTLSTMAQVLGICGLLLVPIGITWLVYDLTRRPAALAVAHGGALPGKQKPLFCDRGPALVGSGRLVRRNRRVRCRLSGDYGCHRAVLGMRVRAKRAQPAPCKIRGGASLSRFNAIPLYLIFVPLALASLDFALLPLAVEHSRKRGIAAAADMIRDIEAFRSAKGHYPSTLAALWNDYRPPIVGIDRYRYEPSDSAYNLYFEQFSDRFGTQEIVMYNPLDGHQFFSHDMDRLRIPPRALRGGGGHYAVHDARAPHWKYFWFD